MFWFGFWIFILVVVIVAASVLIGRTISRRDGNRLSRQQQVTAFKVAGGMRNRKENRN
jgi:hypothetical protein